MRFFGCSVFFVILARSGACSLVVGAFPFYLLASFEVLWPCVFYSRVALKVEIFWCSALKFSEAYSFGPLFELRLLAYVWFLEPWKCRNGSVFLWVFI